MGASTSDRRTISAPPLHAVSRPRALARGHVLTKASPVLQFEAAAALDVAEPDLVASFARAPTSDVAIDTPAIPVIRRIVRHTLVDPAEVTSRTSRTPASHRYGVIVLAAAFAAALGALAGIGMRAVTPAAAPQVGADVHAAAR